MNSAIFSAANPQTLSETELQTLLTAARGDDAGERRSAPRYTCFLPVGLLPTDGSRQRLSAYSRDVSVEGVGLLHAMPIARGAIFQVTLHGADGDFSKPAQVMWCKSAGEGWYLSGWRFVREVE